MHEQNIKLLRDEAMRLLDIEIDILEQMDIDKAGILTNAKANEKQTFDKSSVKKQIEILQGEKNKLQDLKMVLAVVGTMKSGKSTTINAIVGTEVLPNRNRPMTALPTLIQHTPNQKEPLLKFDHVQPLHTHIKALQITINTPENKSVIEKLSKDADMDRLIQLIKKDYQPATCYQGAEAIFDFLRTLNDLVRLSSTLQKEFPFSDYSNIHQLPIIELEFSHLREMGHSEGKLILLDTPGPNEAGQPELKKMLTDQLQKASAVLSILDYTQLKSDADAQVRENLLEIAKIAEGRLYTLVNKFDQRDRNSDGEKQVKNYVSIELMRGKVSPDNVFPVSSRWGYLANRARHEMTLHQALPSPSAKEHAWVEDFAKEALGRRWETKINDVSRVNEGIEYLWEDSLFHEPLEKVIHKAHSQAASYAVDAAAAKLVDTASRMANFLNIRETSLSKGITELQEQIKNLRNDESKILIHEKKSKEKSNEKIQTLTCFIENSFEGTKNEIFKNINEYFEKGWLNEESYREKELVNHENEQNKGRIDDLSNIHDFFTHKKRKNNTSKSKNNMPDFSLKDPKIKFGNTERAIEFLNNIHSALSRKLHTNETDIRKNIDRSLIDFKKEFSKDIVYETQKIISKMQSRMNSSGFSIDLAMPSSSKLSLGFSSNDTYGNFFHKKTESETRYKRSKGAWGTVCGWFGTDDWGWEEYEVEKYYYEVDIKKIKRRTDSVIKETLDNLKLAIQDQIKSPIDKNINDFFEELKETIEKIRGDIIQGINDHEKSKKEQEALIKEISRLNKKVPDLQQDSKEVKNDVAKKINADANVVRQTEAIV